MCLAEIIISSNSNNKYPSAHMRTESFRSFPSDRIFEFRRKKVEAGGGCTIYCVLSKPSGDGDHANHVQQGTGQIVVKRRESSTAAVRKLSLYQYNKVSPRHGLQLRGGGGLSQATAKH